MGLIYDFIVVGLGAHGSSTLYQLSKTDKKVLGIDSFSIGHNNGSSHGESRMIRFSYSNGEHYVPMLLRSKEIWNEIENERKLNDNRFQIDLTLHTEKTIPNSFIQTIEDIISFFGKNNSLTSHRKLEKKVSEKFIYDPLILSFSDVKSPLDVLVKMRELGGNVLIRKIEYTTLTDNRKKSGLTIYLSVIHMDWD